MSANRSVGPTGSGEGGQGRPDALQDAELAAAQTAPARPPAPDRSHVISPLVARLAALHGVDLSTVRGTGEGARITKQDVLRAAESASEADAAPTDEGESAAADAAPAAPGAPADPEAPAATEAPPAPFPDAGEGREGAATSEVPLSPVRRAIAEHMVRAAREIPAAWSMVEVDVSGLVRAREARRAEFERAHGASLTYLPFAAKAVADALLRHPLLNARWDGDRITLHHRVDLGVAMATDAGLIVPVVFDAAPRSIAEIAVELRRLVIAARAGALRVEDVQGGTFTLNNTGALGSVASGPIINHPQAAILTTEAVVKRPVVVEGDAIAVRSMMNLCLAFDHRVCDGAQAAAFLLDVKRSLEAVDEATPLD